PVGRSEILDAHALGHRGELGVAPRHLRVGEHEVTAGVRADRDRPRTERDLRPALAEHLRDERARRGAAARRGGREPGHQHRAAIEGQRAEDTPECYDSPVRAIATAFLIAGACSDPTLQVTIDLPDAFRPQIAEVALADYEHAGLTCDQIAF